MPLTDGQVNFQYEVRRARKALSPEIAKKFRPISVQLAR